MRDAPIIPPHGIITSGRPSGLVTFTLLIESRLFLETDEGAWSLIERSGAGKSTLLKISGLESRRRQRRPASHTRMRMARAIAGPEMPQFRQYHLGMAGLKR